MGILIGMDEAGYGPNLGPLVVAATAWEVADEQGAGSEERGAETGRLRNADRGSRVVKSRSQSTIRKPTSEIQALDLYRRLRRAIARSASDTRLAIADSKILYKPGLGLRQLERGVHTALGALNQSAGSWSELLDSCGAERDSHRGLCWHEGFDCRLPVDATQEELPPLVARFAHACDASQCRPLAIRARLIFPAQFNELVDCYGTKGAALSHVTIGLLREAMDFVRAAACPPTNFDALSRVQAGLLSLTPDPRPLTPIHAVCDKHGGRNFYTAVLQHHFPDDWVEPLFESRAESHYEWGPADSRVRVTFRTNGEAFLPTALASMTAKYLRELAMRAFNEFWCARVPGLRPTAGYPADAPRFKQAIAAMQCELGVDDHVLWRNR